MMKGLRKVLLLLTFCATTIFAQNISVSSFKLLENDLTANTTGTIEKDQNGETAALIKVVTTQQGFVFDGGMVGIVKTKQGVGEVWVYVPHGIKKITVQHPQLGVLRDYYFPITIEKAKTYEMKLTTSKVVTTVERKAEKQYVMFCVSPANAIVELDGMPLDVDSEGYAEKSMPYGTYDYRVSCANYHTEAGKIIVSAEGKVEKSVSLRPNFGWIDFRGANDYHGAQVYIDGELIGQLPLKSDVLKSGTYRVKVLKSLYKPYEQQVTVTDNNTTSLDVTLVPNFANITLTTDAKSEIWVDGRQRGKGKCSLDLELGEYTVEVKRPSHRTVSDVITISELTDRTIQLSSPTPIYGVLDISSTPSRATVLVDGVEVGQTPLILDNVLVGEHELKFAKDGYIEQTKTVDIKENDDHKLNIVLSEKPKEVDVKITSNPSRAIVNVDYKAIGRTPLEIPIKIGCHNFSVSKKGYWTSTQNGKEINASSGNLHFELEKEPKVKKDNSTSQGYLYVSRKDKRSYKNFQEKISGFGIGGSLGYSDYHKFNIGVELDLALKSYFGKVGLMLYSIGKYSIFHLDGSTSYWGEEKINVMPMYVVCDFGYLLSLGKSYTITPLIGFMCNVGFASGGSYVSGEVPFATTGGLGKPGLNPNIEYAELDANIAKVAKEQKCKCSFGLRLGLETVDADCIIGLNMTLKYIIKDGLLFNVGIVI